MEAKRITTLEGLPEGSITLNRRCGNTTRLIDNAIQIIFSGNICVVKDHYDTRRCHEDLYGAIIRRIKIEHNWLFHQRMIKFDKMRLEIRLLEKPEIIPSILGTGVKMYTD